MITPATFTLQINQFSNCKGCIDKVKEALGKLDDVKLLEMNPEMGKFMILTAAHPDAIKCAIKIPFPRKKITLSLGTNDHLVPLQDAQPFTQLVGKQQQFPQKVQTSTVPIALQISSFCNCEGCIRKVKTALDTFDDVKLLGMDPEMGLFTILTTTHPDAIKCAIQRPFPEKKISCVHLQDALSLETNITPSAPPIL